MIDYLPYVHDSRDFLKPLLESVRWNGLNFEYKEEWKDNDIKLSLSDVERTTSEFVKAKLSLIDFLNFECEHSNMFHDLKLPTLDATVWVNRDGLLSYNFYEKHMCHTSA